MEARVLLVAQVVIRARLRVSGWVEGGVGTWGGGPCGREEEFILRLSVLWLGIVGGGGF